MSDVKKPQLYIWATGPKGNRARFDDLQGVPVGWIVDGMTAPLKVKEQPAQAEKPKKKAA